MKPKPISVTTTWLKIRAPPGPPNAQVAKRLRGREVVHRPRPRRSVSQLPREYNDRILADFRAFTRETITRVERLGREEIRELRRLGDEQRESRAEIRDLREESRAQREALLRMIDRLGPGNATA
jgi:hypothetical protein